MICKMQVPGAFSGRAEMHHADFLIKKKEVFKKRRKVVYFRSNIVFVYIPKGNSIHFPLSKKSQLKLL